MRSTRLPIVLATLFFAEAVRGANALPDWAREASTRVMPTYSSDVTSVHLLREEAVTVEADGRRTMRERAVVKILQKGEEVGAYRTYNTKAGKIRDFQGWSITPSGNVSAMAKNRIADVAVSPREIYDEARAKVLSFGVPPVGTIVAWEIVEEEKTVFTQYRYSLQDDAPSLLSRFTLTLPAAWEVASTVLNGAAIKTTVAGTTTTWEQRDLPFVKSEDYGPPLSSLVPILAVSYFPPESNPAGLRALKDWTAVSTWLSTLVDPPARVTEKVRAKSAELTKSSTGDFEKIRAIGRFAQQTNYVSVDLNITRGGGYTPHRSEDVLARNYGDCKDKATLVRSLLEATGIEAYLTTIYSGDPYRVHPEWASPQQFNHAIVAIRVPDSVQAPAVLIDPSLGRLLMFDPTDPLTPVGEIPLEEQGSHALIIAGTKGALLKMPKQDVEASRIESIVEGSIDALGSLTATVERSYFGSSGTAIRGLAIYGGEPELKKRFERTYARRIPGGVLASVATEHRESDNVQTMKMGVTANRFAIPQGRLFIVRPGLLTSGGEYYLVDEKRLGPIQLDADRRHDSIHIRIPAGFKADEVPRPARLESPYGTLETKWTVTGEEIVMEETLEVREIVAPAEDYPKVRDFFERVYGAHGAPVVLMRP